MADQISTSSSVSDEIAALRARVAELETSEQLRQQTAEALRQSEERYRGLFENASLGIFHTLPEGRFVRANSKLAQLLGYASPEDLMSIVSDIGAQVYADPGAREELLEAARQSSSWVQAEHLLCRKDGSTLISSITLREVHHPDGTLAYLEGFVEDISEWRRLAHAEREQRVLAEALRDTAGAVAGTLNLDEVFDRVLQNVGRVIPHQAALIMLLDEDRSTAAVARYFGYMPWNYEAYSYDLRLKLAETRNLLALFETKMPLVIADVRQYDGWQVYPGGEWIRSHAGVAICVQDEVIGFLNLYSAAPGFYHDDHAARLQTFADQAAIAIQNARLHAQLERHADVLEQSIAAHTRELWIANERLQELDHLKNEFIARIGHELLTPVANLKHYVELVKSGKPENYLAYLQTLKQETDRLLVLVQDLLRVRQISTEEIELEVKSGDINQIISERLIGWREQAARRGLEFHVQLQPDLPLVLIDSDYVAHVIGHVVNNALNYTTAGSITVETAIRSDAAGRWVIVNVIDTGPGIASADLPHIFDRFYRGRAASNYKTPGIGVGLSISREIMHKLNGRLTVMTENGAGATFTIWLPVPASALRP